IEARICAENPENNFLPATGTLNVYRKPACSSFAISEVRVDDGVREGDAISPFYDSMIAKLIVHGETRAQALARLDAALQQTHIVGLATNVQFLRQVVKSKAFATAKLDTALIERERAALFGQDAVGRNLAIAAAVATTLEQEKATQSADPFSQRDGWSMYGRTQRYFQFAYQGVELAATLAYAQGGAPAQLRVTEVGDAAAAAGQPQDLQWRAVAAGLDLQLGAQRSTVQVYMQGEAVTVFTPAGSAQLTEVDLLAHAGDSGSEGGRLTAPMPGKVVSFAVKAGDAVTKGQPLAVMEAMKMEHTIAAPADGVVQELLYAPGDQVTEGAELIRISA
ncbi:MAG: biotin/lipoyl-containing protein, partial [Comamonas sp.]